MNLDTLRETQAKQQNGGVGTSATLAKCIRCGEETGVVSAWDKNAWMILSVPPETLDRLYEALELLKQQGMTVPEMIATVQRLVPEQRIA